MFITRTCFPDEMSLHNPGLDAFLYKPLLSYIWEQENKVCLIQGFCWFSANIGAILVFRLKSLVIVTPKHLMPLRCRKHGFYWKVFMLAASCCIWQLGFSYPISWLNCLIVQYPSSFNVSSMSFILTIANTFIHIDSMSSVGHPIQQGPNLI